MALGPLCSPGSLLVLLFPSERARFANEAAHFALAIASSHSSDAIIIIMEIAKNYYGGCYSELGLLRELCRYNGLRVKRWNDHLERMRLFNESFYHL